MIEALASADPLTPEDCEATAWPSDVGDYWTEWNPFRVAQQPFADKVAQVDGDAQDKLNKKMLGARMVVVRKWFNDLPKSKLEGTEKVATSCNKLGCPDEEK